jgi:hypothetical protein
MTSSLENSAAQVPAVMLYNSSPHLSFIRTTIFRGNHLSFKWSPLTLSSSFSLHFGVYLCSTALLSSLLLPVLTGCRVQLALRVQICETQLEVAYRPLISLSLYLSRCCRTMPTLSSVATSFGHPLSALDAIDWGVATRETGRFLV